MVGYKIYFNGKKFVLEENKSIVEKVPNDSTVSWNVGLDTGIAAVDSLNKHYKSKPEELVKANDFLIRTCRECNNYFILGSLQVDWFKYRDLKLPCRCISCRKKNK